MNFKKIKEGLQGPLLGIMEGFLEEGLSTVRLENQKDIGLAKSMVGVGRGRGCEDESQCRQSDKDSKTVCRQWPRRGTGKRYVGLEGRAGGHEWP